MKNHTLVQKVTDIYANAFGGKHIVVRSPGRVNIIGEHTDYNEGFVLPAAIDKAAFVAVGQRTDKIIKLYSVAFNETYETGVEQILPTDKGWPNYILGVADQMIKRGYDLKGFNLVLDADIPIGAGVSSSAAVECASAFALNELFGFGIERKELALVAQKAEHVFAGVMCGIMDQFASIFGKKDHVIRLDCRSLEYEFVPFKLDNYSILLLNTNVQHSLASSEYNIRRRQCEEGVALINKFHRGVNSLRDANLEMLKRHVEPVNKEIYRRCKYVIEENIRLMAACEDLKQGNLIALGRQMLASHEGLKNDYNVSCTELDYLVDLVKENTGVAGARMMGGGFGGCTINLVENKAIDALVSEASFLYQRDMGRQLTSYVARPDEGTTLID